MNALVVFLATVGYIGWIPVAPATALSAIICIVAFFFPSPRWIEPVAVASTVVGLLIARRATEVFQLKDPRPFVLDELAGMTLTLAFLPLDARTLVAAFVLFRFFDILKPLGIRRLDRMKHPTGIVWDDLLAGVYANLALQVLTRWLW
ncbi:MAG TPA: phosphatidylglycerophosphatase A [Candidatus Eisenbacteria bacterium]|nr:phosphatidylglycerophosphatase A [Candidatus Eisenbacteria bacterium]